MIPKKSVLESNVISAWTGTEAIGAGKVRLQISFLDSGSFAEIVPSRLAFRLGNNEIKS